MNELINTHDSRVAIHWKLLSGASAAALLVSAFGAGEVRAADSDTDRPQVWIELGGQLQHLSNSQDAFSPPFIASITQKSLSSALDVQKPIAYAIDGDASILIQPKKSNWIFSASVRYGRSQAEHHKHQQTQDASIPKYQFTFFGHQFGTLINAYEPNGYEKFADGRASRSEQHTVLDFEAGKDVGLGLFGKQGSSVLSAGVRIAQFTSKTSVNLQAIPDLQYPTAPIASVYEFVAFHSFRPHFHSYAATTNIIRSFRGVGPSVSWAASVPFAGNSGSGELTFDWGANAALLFGRQVARGSHHTKARGLYGGYWEATAANANQGDHKAHGNFFGSSAGKFEGSASTTVLYDRSIPINRARSVSVPNLGGFAGISFAYPNAKISFGYKADFFFGAIDGGIDARKTYDRNFYGPFATVSIGLGG